MTKWLTPFLENGSAKCTDNTDRFRSETNMSVLSVRSERVLDQNLKNESKKRTDITDKFKSKTNMSVLSVHPEGALDQNLENGSKISTDNTDRFNSEVDIPVSSLEDSFDERAAIIEYDGHQAPLQAQQMAYLDTFLTLLFELTASDSQKEWLVQKVQSARATLETLNLPHHL